MCVDGAGVDVVRADMDSVDVGVGGDSVPKVSVLFFHVLPASYPFNCSFSLLLNLLELTC